LEVACGHIHRQRYLLLVSRVIRTGNSLSNFVVSSGVERDSATRSDGSPRMRLLESRPVSGELAVAVREPADGPAVPVVSHFAPRLVAAFRMIISRGTRPAAGVQEHALAAGKACRASTPTMPASPPPGSRSSVTAVPTRCATGFPSASRGQHSPRTRTAPSHRAPCVAALSSASSAAAGSCVVVGFTP